MLIGAEIVLPAGFDVVQAGLARLARTGWLLRFPRDEGGVPVDGPGASAASADGALGLAAVVFGEQNPAAPAELPLRWESVVVGGFPFELDASLRIAPAERDGTALSLAGTCQPAPGTAALERDTAARMAVECASAFVTSVAAAIIDSGAVWQAAATPTAWSWLPDTPEAQ